MDAKQRYGSAGARAAAIVVVLTLLPVLAACGNARGWTIEGRLVAGDTDVWLIDTTPVGIGAATITGDAPAVGARVRATGRRENGRAPVAESIVVGPSDPAAPASRLAPQTVRGRIETGDAASGVWTVSGTPVRVPPGTGGAAQLATGRNVTVQGYTLPGGSGVLASTIAVDLPPTPTPAPTRAPAPPTRAVPTSAPVAPTQPQPKKPTKKDGDSDSSPSDHGNDD